MSAPDIRPPKRPAKRSHGNMSPVPGDVADGMLYAEKLKGGGVRACETPEYFALHGCPHRGDVSGPQREKSDAREA